MNINDYCKEIEKKAKEIDKLAKDILPKKIGNLAKRHYQDNFRKGGFVDNGLKPWQKAKRQSSKTPNAKYGTLLSRQRNLFKGVEYIPTPYGVKICNNVPYAPTHNWGESVHPTVTPKMRRFAWAKYFQSIDAPPKGIKRSVANPKRKNSKIKFNPVGIKVNNEAMLWKGLALTKKKKLNIKMPQRQFIGESTELNEKIREKTELEITNILNK